MKQTSWYAENDRIIQDSSTEHTKVKNWSGLLQNLHKPFFYKNSILPIPLRIVKR